MMVIMVSVKSMIKNILEYIKWSNLLIKFRLNPFRWHISYSWHTHSDMDPGMLINAHLEFGPLEIALWIDDGSW